MAFEGKDKSYSALDDRLFDGPLVPLRDSSANGGDAILQYGVIENTFTAMRPFIFKKLDTLVDSIRREGSWEYPMGAIRESVVNAVSHRDWTRNEEIEVV